VEKASYLIVLVAGQGPGIERAGIVAASVASLIVVECSVELTVLVVG
jgi:hypothetical protein